MKPLTTIQRCVLEFMHEYFAENDQLPSSRTISNHFGWKSANTAFEVLRALHVKGYIEPNAAGKYKFVKVAA